jgi:hypothetical protein
MKYAERLYSSAEQYAAALIECHEFGHDRALYAGLDLQMAALLDKYSDEWTADWEQLVRDNPWLAPFKREFTSWVAIELLERAPKLAKEEP